MPKALPSGTWYVLVWNLKLTTPVVAAPGLSLRPLNAPLTVWDLAAAGAVGFKEWATLEPFVHNIHCEVETAKDADVHPGYDSSTALVNLLSARPQRFWTFASCGMSAYSWQTIAGHQERTKPLFQQQLAEERVRRGGPLTTAFPSTLHRSLARLPYPHSGLSRRLQGGAVR